MAEKRYTVHDMATTFGISRTTLIYYEKLGIIQPQRVGQADYRTYSYQDVFRLMCATILKNVGIEPRKLGDILDDDPISSEHFRDYIALSNQRMEYYRAQQDCLVKLDDLHHKLGSIEIVDVESYYIVWDQAETGYHDFPRNPNLDLLMAHMPIGGLGSCASGDFAEEGFHAPNHWGRTVPVRFAGLIPGFEGDGDVIGGCRCLRAVYFSGNIYAPPDDVMDALRDRMLAEIDSLGLEAVGPAFAPYSLPSDQGFYVPTCVPVRRKES